MKTEIAWWSRHRKGRMIKFWDIEKMDIQILEGGDNGDND